MIGRVHNTTRGHYGVELTLKKLKEHGLNWQHMRAHVTAFIRQCPLCQKTSQIKYVIVTRRPFTTAAREPMERISIDAIGSLPESCGGFMYILVVIDCFTRFVELYPLVLSTGGEEAARCLACHAGRYGTPYQILNDGILE